MKTLKLFGDTYEIMSEPYETENKSGMEASRLLFPVIRVIKVKNIETGEIKEIEAGWLDN